MTAPIPAISWSPSSDIVSPAEAERTRAAEAERTAELARAELARAAEAERTAELARKAEAERTRAELARKAEAERTAELARAAEAERTAELARKAEAERTRAEQARKAEAERTAELARAAEAERTAELARAAEAERTAELARAAEAERTGAPAGHKTAFRLRRPARQQAAELSDHFRWSGDLRFTDALHSARARGPASSSWRRHAVVLVVATMVLITAAAVTFSLFLYSGTGGARNGAGPLDSDVAIRTLAAAWVARQVAPGDIVACDPVMCAALKAQKFPERNLRVLRPASPYPLSSNVVIATARVRDQFGSSLSSAYAPEALVRFGTGIAGITIRITAQHGAVPYMFALKADVHERKLDGASLLGIKQIRFSATARAQLAAGKVDTRLIFTITHLARHHHQVYVWDFGDSVPGASPNIPLRMVDVTETAGTGHMSAAYVRSIMLAVMQEQFPPFRPMRAWQTRLAGGQAVLRIEFPAPSPLGPLGSGGY